MINKAAVWASLLAAIACIVGAMVSFLGLLDFELYRNARHLFRLVAMDGCAELQWFDVGDVERMAGHDPQQSSYAGWLDLWSNAQTYGVTLDPKQSGFYYSRRPSAGSNIQRSDGSSDKVDLFVWTRVGFPIWPVILLFLVAPAVAFYRGPWRIWHRRRKGQCIHCGYDLRGSESGECPECGAAYSMVKPNHKSA